MIYQQQTAVVEATIVLGSSFLSFSSAAVATTMVVATVSLAEMTDVDSAETTAHASSSFYFFSASAEMATTTAAAVDANPNLKQKGNRSGSPFFCILHRHISVLLLNSLCDRHSGQSYEILIKYLPCL